MRSRHTGSVPASVVSHSPKTGKTHALFGYAAFYLGAYQYLRAVWLRSSELPPFGWTLVLAVGRSCLILLGALVALAAFLRLLWLATLPQFMSVDEGYNGVDALRVAAGHVVLFFAQNNGREPLFLLFQGLVAVFLPPGLLALHLPSAVLGILTVPLTFILATLLFQDEVGLRQGKSLGLLAAFSLAVSLWHLHLSRTGLRIVAFPLFQTAMLITLLLALRHRRIGWALAAGALLGGALYTYLPARLLPLLFGITWLLWGLFQPGAPVLPVQAQVSGRKGQFRTLLVAIAAFLISSAPLLFYFLQHQSAFFWRANTVSLFNPAVNQGDLIQAILGNLRNVAEMFTLRGDRDPELNIAAQPVFSLPLSLFFLIGLLTLLWRWRRRTSLFLFSWVGIMVLPVLLSAPSVFGGANFFRAVGLLPAVQIICAVGFYEALRWVPRIIARVRRQRGSLGENGGKPIPVWEQRVRQALLVLLVCWCTGQSYWYYFVYNEQANASRAKGYHELLALSGYIEQLPAQLPVFVATHEGLFAPLAYLTRLQPRVTLVDGRNSVALPPFSTRRSLYIFEHDWYSQTDLAALSRWYTLSAQPLPQTLPHFVAYLVIPGPGLNPPHLTLPAPVAEFATGIEVLDFDLPIEAHPGQTVQVLLHWRVAHFKGNDPGQDYTFFVHLIDREHHLQAGEDGVGLWPVQWRAGQEVLSWYSLRIPTGAKPGKLQLELGMYSRADLVRVPIRDPQGHVLHELLFGSLKLPVPAIEGAPTGTPAHLASVSFGNQIRLRGYTLGSSPYYAGGKIHLILYWQALERPEKDYTTFVQVLDQANHIHGQRDAQPLDGAYPTTLWSTGEQVTDTYDIAINPNSPPGSYRLLIGWYAQPALQRLRITSPATQGGDAWVLATLSLA